MTKTSIASSPRTSRRVWLVNRNEGHDYRNAKEFGEIIPLSEGMVSPLATDRFLERVKDRLDQVGPEDYVLLSGHLLLNAVVCGYLARRNGWLRVLTFLSKQRIYVPRFIELRHLEELKP